MRYIYFGKQIKCSVFLPVFVFLWLNFTKNGTALFCLAAVAVHETGHIAAGFITGKKITAVTLSPLGADIEYTLVSSYVSDLLTALAGPFVSIISGLLTFKAFYTFSVISAVYGLLNLIPVPCFDGARVLRCALYYSVDTVKADGICGAVNVTFLIIMYLFSVFLLFYTSFNASLLLVSAYVFCKSYIKMK